MSVVFIHTMFREETETQTAHAANTENFGMVEEPTQGDTQSLTLSRRRTQIQANILLTERPTAHKPTTHTHTHTHTLKHTDMNKNKHTNTQAHKRPTQAHNPAATQPHTNTDGYCTT